VLGVEASMWGESTVTEGDVDHSTWPRLCALAEIAWTQRALRDYDDFLVRLSPHSVRMRCFGVLFGIPIGRG
jgi:hexosaminidase